MYGNVSYRKIIKQRYIEMKAKKSTNTYVSIETPGRVCTCSFLNSEIP